MAMKIVEVVIGSNGKGDDLVTLYTDTPSPYEHECSLVLQFSAPDGVSFIRENFPEIEHLIIL